MKLLNFQRHVPGCTASNPATARQGADWPPPDGSEQDQLSAEGDFPVQNGKVSFTLIATATFRAACSPPMTGHGHRRRQMAEVTLYDV
jgi:hypothetical protein